jgi:DNA-binding transcriptional ArsR family regulator
MSSGNADSDRDPRIESYQGWLFLRPEAVPEHWSDRSVPMNLVPLLPEEVGEFAGMTPADPYDDVNSAKLVTLVARGKSIHDIAREMKLGERTVDRHVKRLREKYGVTTKGELSALLARLGFGNGAEDAEN